MVGFFNSRFYTEFLRLEIYAALVTILRYHLSPLLSDTQEDAPLEDRWEVALHFCIHANPVQLEMIGRDSDLKGIVSRDMSFRESALQIYQMIFATQLSL